MAETFERSMGRPLRVLHLTREFPPVVWGGLGTAVGGLANASSTAGMDVTVLLIGHAGGGGYADSETWAPPTGEPGAHRLASTRILETMGEEAYRAAIGLIALWRPDVIHVHPVELGRLARALALGTAIPLVYTVHSVNIAEYAIGQEPSEVLHLWHLQQDLIRAADRIIAISESERELLARYAPDVGGRVRVVGNGIADMPERPVRKDGLVGGTVLYVGRFVTRKGIHDLFQAVPAILERAPDTRFVLVGGYGSSDEIGRAWLPDALTPIRDRIRFTGWLRSDEMEQWYEEATVLVVPSWYEPFGMVVLEGMVRGLPIAAAAVGGPAEILDHERTGLLFPPKDSAGLSEAVLRLLLNPPLRAALGQAARAEVHSRWLWSRLVEMVRRVYLEAIWDRSAA